MPRPRKDSTELSGKRRIREAFWSIYLEKSLKKVTVKEICERAKCNKTTFYYHYQSIEEVLRELEEYCMPKDTPGIVVDLLSQGENDSALDDYLPKYDERFDILCHLLSSKGDPAFSRRVKEVMKLEWCKAFDISYDMLSNHDRLLIEFTMGGTTSLLASYGDGQIFDFRELIVILRETLTPHLNRVLRDNNSL